MAAREFFAGGDDGQRRAEDVGIFFELIDGGDAIGVEGNQADAAFLAELEIGGELGEGGGLADAGGTDQGDDVRAGSFAADDRAGGGQEFFDLLGEFGADEIGAGECARDGFDAEGF